jgi:hypothetical protein
LCDAGFPGSTAFSVTAEFATEGCADGPNGGEEASTALIFRIKSELKRFAERMLT